jgi:hypothetical protein
MMQTFSVRRVVSAVDRTWENIYPTFSSSLGSTLLLIKKATHDPLYLWDITPLQRFASQAPRPNNPNRHFNNNHTRGENYLGGNRNPTNTNPHDQGSGFYTCGHLDTSPRSVPSRSQLPRASTLRDPIRVKAVDPLVGTRRTKPMLPEAA